MSRDKWKIIGKSDDCGRCKIPAAAKHPVTSVGCVCKYLPVAARLREPIRGEAGDSGDASATPAADRSSGRIRMCPPGSGCCSAKSPRYGVISNSGAKRDCCDLRYGGRSLTLHVIKLEWLDAGDEPVFFDLFRNGKRYLLSQFQKYWLSRVNHLFFRASKPFRRTNPDFFTKNGKKSNFGPFSSSPVNAGCSRYPFVYVSLISSIQAC